MARINNLLEICYIYIGFEEYYEYSKDFIEKFEKYFHTTNSFYFITSSIPFIYILLPSFVISTPTYHVTILICQLVPFVDAHKFYPVGQIIHQQKY